MGRHWWQTHLAALKSTGASRDGVPEHRPSGRVTPPGASGIPICVQPGEFVFIRAHSWLVRSCVGLPGASRQRNPVELSRVLFFVERMRFSTFGRGVWGSVLAVVLSVASWGAEEKVSTPPPPPYPEILAAAPGQRWSFNEVDAMSEDPLRPGDEAIALVTLFDGETEKQWVVVLTVVTPTPDEQKRMVTPPPLTLYTSNGTQLQFQNELALLETKTFGPFHPKKRNNKALNPRRARTGVNVEHLKLGFDRACSTLLRFREASRHIPDADRFGMHFGPQPFPAEKIEQTRRVANLVGLTTEDEKAFAGTLPALFGFFQIALNTPGLQEILMEVVDVPFWSVVRKGGKVEPYFNFDAAHMAELPANNGMRQYSMPVTLTLNGKHALNLTFGVVAPKSPVLTTAGIVGMAANHPTDPSKRAVIQLVSAKRANQASPASP